MDALPTIPPVSAEDRWAGEQMLRLMPELTLNRARYLIERLAEAEGIKIAFWTRVVVEEELERTLTDEEWAAVQATDAWGEIEQDAYDGGRPCLAAALEQAGLTGNEVW